MLKLLLLIGVLAAVYFMFFKKKTLTPPSEKREQEEDTMLPCAKCGTYVQITEAFMRDGKYYCSRECMEG